MNEERLVKEIAGERIGRLITLAKASAKHTDSEKLSKRYVKLAREISTHYKVGMSDDERNSICKKCNNILIPGKNCKVTLSSSEGCAIYKCECGAEKRIFYK